MFWRERKHLQLFLRDSLWVAPVLSMLAAIPVARLTRFLDEELQWPLLAFGLDGARAAVAMVAAALLSFVVFFFSVLLLTVQVASGNLTARIIARPFRSNALKAALSLFVFTFAYGTSVMGHLEQRVLQLSLLLTLVLSVISIGAFLFIVEYIGKELRPASIMTAVAREGRAVIRSVYPLPWTATPRRQPGFARSHEAERCTSYNYAGRAGVIHAIDVPGLLKTAIRHNCVIEMLPQVGDFVAEGAPLFKVYGAEPVPYPMLSRSIALGEERTIEQDPAFVFRIIVDIAEKALSPAINDPTTGVLAIDQIQRLLQELANRDLTTGIVCDENGNVRVVYDTPNWDDFVSLAVAEIRQYGTGSIQIMRRLRCMLQDLIRIAPAERACLLQQQLDLLHATVERGFLDPWDRGQAEIADSQGLGGARHHAAYVVDSGSSMKPKSDRQPCREQQFESAQQREHDGYSD